MAYDRYDSPRGWREPRSRFAGDYPDRGSRHFDREDRDERGFFERAGDEVASWFGDEEAERRRQMDSRYEDSDRRSFMGPDDDFTRYDRPRFRDEGNRRPYTGRPMGRGRPGDRFGPERYSQDRWDRGLTQRDFSVTAPVLHDPHYSEWRRSQVDALDRDYDEFRRENQSRFEDEFSSWRTARQAKRQMLGDITEHMNVVGSDEEHLGTVDKVRGDRIILAKGDSEDGDHHSISCSLIDRVEGDRVILAKPAAEARRHFSNENRDRALFERDDRREPGPHMLNRSFSGTY